MQGQVLCLPGKEQHISSNNNDIEIDLTKKITNNKNFVDLVPEVKEKGCKQVKIHQTDYASYEFYGIGENNELIQLKSLEITEGTDPTENIVETNEDGSKVTKNQVQAMFRIKGGNNTGLGNEGFAIDTGETGIKEVSYWIRDRDDRYTSVPVNLKTTNQKYTDKSVREYATKEKNSDVSDNIERAEQRIQESSTQETTLNNIDDDPHNNDIEQDDLSDYIQVLIQEAAERCKIDIDAFMAVYENVDGKTVEGRIEAAEEEINEQFRGVIRGR